MLLDVEVPAKAKHAPMPRNLTEAAEHFARQRAIWGGVNVSLREAEAAVSLLLEHGASPLPAAEAPMLLKMNAETQRIAKRLAARWSGNPRPPVNHYNFNAQHVTLKALQ